MECRIREMNGAFYVQGYKRDQLLADQMHIVFTGTELEEALANTWDWVDLNHLGFEGIQRMNGFEPKAYMTLDEASTALQLFEETK